MTICMGIKKNYKVGTMSWSVRNHVSGENPVAELLTSWLLKEPVGLEKVCLWDMRTIFWGRDSNQLNEAPLNGNMVRCHPVASPQLLF